MRYRFLFGLALLIPLIVPVTGITQTPDSVIIGNATFTPGQNQVFVPVYFVTYGDVTHYNLPIRVESAGDIQFVGQQVGPFLQNWDDAWQGIKDDHRHAVQMGFADLGGEDNPSLNTNGARVKAMDLVFSVSPNPTTDSAAIVPEIDDRSGGPIFGLSDGIAFVTPIIINGTLRLDTATGQPTPEKLPTEISLAQNYPNPFNPTTEISYALPDARDVKLTVFNVLGQTVRGLVAGPQDAGYHRVTWDGTDNGGHQVPSGTYFYKLEAGPFSQSMKMVLLK